MDEVAIVEGLEAEVAELEIAGGVELGAEAGKVEAEQFRRVELVGEAFVDPIDEG